MYLEHNMNDILLRVEAVNAACVIESSKQHVDNLLADAEQIYNFIKTGDSLPEEEVEECKVRRSKIS